MWDRPDFVTWAYLTDYRNEGFSSLSDIYAQEKTSLIETCSEYCTLWIIALCVTLFALVATHVYWAWVNNNRKWANKQEQTIRDAFQTKKKAPRKAPKPVRTRRENTPYSMDEDGPLIGPILGFADDEAFPDLESVSTISPISLPITPPPSSRLRCRNTAPVHDSPVEALKRFSRETTAVESPSSKKTTPYTPRAKTVRKSPAISGWISWLSNSFWTKKADLHDWVRPYECGRIHGSPEDHTLHCSPDSAARAELIAIRDDDWEARLHERARRIHKNRLRARK